MLPSGASLCSEDDVDFFSFFDLLDFDPFTFNFGFFSFNGIDFLTTSLLPRSPCIDSESSSKSIILYFKK